MKEEKKTFLDPNTKLHQLWTFRLALGLPLTFAIILVGVIWSQNWSEICFSATFSCLNGFFPAYKVPLSIASLGLALAALVSQMHRSGQTVEAMKIAGENNRFANRFKLKSEFSDFKNQIEPKKLFEPEIGAYATLFFMKQFDHFQLFFPDHGDSGITVDESTSSELVKGTLSEFDDWISQQVQDFSELTLLLKKSGLSIDWLRSEQELHAFIGLCEYEAIALAICNLYEEATSFMLLSSDIPSGVKPDKSNMPNLFRIKEELEASVEF